MRIGVLNNLRAGKRGSRVPEVLDVLREHPEIPHVETDSCKAVPEALHHLAGQDVDVLVVTGGDGSVQRALTGILADEALVPAPVIAPLRGGRTNMTALDLGVPRSAARALRGIIASAARGDLERRIVERHVLRLEFDAAAEVHYGMFFGAGAIYRAIDLVHRIFPPGRSRGVLGSSLVTGVLLARLAALHDKSGVLTPDKLQILLDGRNLDHSEFYITFATTLDRFFLRMKPFWGTGPDPVRFTALASGAEAVLSALPGILRGRPHPRLTPERGFVSRNVRSADLLLSCGFTLDGEQFHPEANRVLRIDADTTVRFVRG